MPELRQPSPIVLDLDASPAKADAASSPIGIDYTPEARCSDNNWSTATPVACNPQLSFSCSNPSLSLCPTTCQACYVSDLSTLKTKLIVSTITSYQPNY